MSFAQSVQAPGNGLIAVEVRPIQPSTKDLAANSLAINTNLANESWRSNLEPTIAARLCEQPTAMVMGYGGGTGPTSGGMLGIPWYVLQAHSATLLVASGTGSGTLEVWHVDPVSHELRLASGYFGIWDDFRRVSASTHFTKGSGLPGRVWESRQPILFQDLTESGTFLRAVAARAVGLEFGLGLPVDYPEGFGVVVLLSSKMAPIARSVDIWRLHGKSDIEHLHGISLHSLPQMSISSSAVARSLALAAASQFAPLAIETTVANQAVQSAASSSFGWAWPSRDATGVVHVATLVN